MNIKNVDKLIGKRTTILLKDGDTFNGYFFEIEPAFDICMFCSDEDGDLALSISDIKEITSDKA